MYTTHTYWENLCLLSAFFLLCYGDHRDLHSFPTRRSSDLLDSVDGAGNGDQTVRPASQKSPSERGSAEGEPAEPPVTSVADERPDPEAGQREASGIGHYRSEEHTSELQSHVNLVCRLLLEK